MARKSRQQNWGTQSEVSPESLHDHRDDALDALAQQSETNTQTLQSLLDRITDIHGLLLGDEGAGSRAPATGTVPAATSTDHSAELERARDQAFDLKALVADLEQQNRELASQLASRSVAASLSDSHSSSNETLSWEERKQMMLRQMEEDSFDAEAFVESLDAQDAHASLDPIQYVEQLQNELDRRNEELHQRGEQIHELQCLLDQQSETRDGGIAIGAAAITAIFDADELVCEERERLQQMQEEWEEKFRQAEIEASLERAKLSRERQEVARKLSDLEEQLAHAKRESRHAQPAEDGTSRRWLTKLGLADGSA